MTYKRLREYNLTILNRMLNQEKIEMVKDEKEGNLYHLRLRQETIRKIEKVIKEKENK